MTWVRNLDLVLLALALPLFIVAGLPLLGYATALVIWAMWRLIGALAERKAEEANDLGKMAAIATGSMIGRGWLCALAIFAGYFLAGQDDSVGLAAAVLVIVCFTAYFSTAMVLRPLTTPNELPS